MLSVLLSLGIHSAFAGGGVIKPHRESQYNYCMVATLIDWKQEKAMAFQMIGDQQVDLASGVPLLLIGDVDGVADQPWAKLPFDTVFDTVEFDKGRAWSVGGIVTDHPYTSYLTEGQRRPDQVTVQGLTGYLDILDGRPDCNQSAVASIPHDKMSQYTPCMIAVLMDWGKAQALVFRVTKDGQIDQTTAMPLKPTSASSHTQMLVASLPFKSAFTDVWFNPDAQVENGYITTDHPFTVYTMDGRHSGPYPVTIQGMTGYIDMLDGRPDCH